MTDKHDQEDMIVWEDYSWLYRYELPNDYDKTGLEVVAYGTERWHFLQKHHNLLHNAHIAGMDAPDPHTVRFDEGQHSA